MTEAKLKEGADLLKEIQSLKNWRDDVDSFDGIIIGKAGIGNSFLSDSTPTFLNREGRPDIGAMIGFKDGVRNAIFLFNQSFTLQIMDQIIAEKQRQFDRL